uniref:Carboxylesterase type B domain-containing protein n=1 Tax=Gouania willdenowi TaxID=441366 RepID=A0A8C5HPS6_GOUWI
TSMASIHTQKTCNELFLCLICKFSMCLCGFSLDGLVSCNHPKTCMLDYVFLCPSRKSARVGTTAGSEVWMYEFDHVASDHRVWSGLTFCYQHACHGAELPFLFDSASVTNFTLTLAEKLLSNRMLCYWGAFAHTGDPSSRVHQTPFCREQRLPVWPRYSDTSGWLFMNLTVHSHAQVGTREHIWSGALFYSQSEICLQTKFSMSCFGRYY